MPKIPKHGWWGIRQPTKGTLRRYGLDLEDWLELLKAQGGVCAICGRVPASGILCIDHEHVRKWRKMQSADRRKYVRGLACPHCNHRLLGRFVTLDRAKKVVEYLELYQRRKGCSE